MKPINNRERASDSTRILDFRKEIQGIQTWMNSPQATLSPPPLLIIYPTYTCTNPAPFSRGSLLCSNCIYQGFHGTKKSIDIRILSKVLREVTELGVRNIQFSGGGEPLEYHKFDKLLKVLQEIKKKTPDLLLGLLSNGLFLGEERAKQIAALFSYVRLSYSEGTGVDHNLTELFSHNFRHLLNYGRSNSSLRIGLKLLVSSLNCNTLIDQVRHLRHLIGDKYFTRLDHIRVKAMRSVNPNIEVTKHDKIRFTNEFEEIIQREPQIWPGDLQIDLDLGYTAPGFQCYLSPLFGLIDPIGRLVACYNYVEAYEKLVIGDLNSYSFAELWGTEHHKQILGNLDNMRVCNSRKGCSCRFVKYQDIFETSSPTEGPAVPKELARLL